MTADDLTPAALAALAQDYPAEVLRYEHGPRYPGDGLPALPTYDEAEAVLLSAGTSEPRRER